MADREVLDIADLGRRTSTAPSALRYYERLGLLAPAGRAGGRRTYAKGADERVALIRLCQDAGFTLAEIADLLRVRGRRKAAWARMAREKIGQLEARIAETQRAKALLEHGLRCPAPDPMTCPRFQAQLRARLVPAPEPNR